MPRQEKEYHDVPWKMNPADDAARTMRAVIEMSRESGKKAVHLDALKCNTPARPPLRIARLFPGRRKKLAYRKRRSDRFCPVLTGSIAEGENCANIS